MLLHKYQPQRRHQQMGSHSHRCSWDLLVKLVDPENKSLYVIYLSRDFLLHLKTHSL